MINRSVARRYASALLDLVEPEPLGVAEKLAELAGLVESDPDLAQLLVNPLFSLEERSRVLDRILQRLGWGPPLDRFLKLLVERRRIGHLSAIAEEFMAMVDERAGRVRVQVRSAVPLEAASLDELRRVLGEGLSKQVLIEQRVDPALIAGVSIQVGSLVIDGSLQSQIARLKESLAASRA